MKTVIYGLGKRFNRYKAFIEDYFPEAVYCNVDEEKCKKYLQGISLSYLKEHLKDFQRVIFTLYSPVKLLAAIKDLQLQRDQFSFIELEMLRQDRTIALYYGENNVDALLDTAIMSTLGGDCLT